MKTGRPVSSAAMISPSRMVSSMLSATATWSASASNARDRTIAAPLEIADARNPSYLKSKSQSGSSNGFLVPSRRDRLHARKGHYRDIMRLTPFTESAHWLGITRQRRLVSPFRERRRSVVPQD